MRAVVVGIFVLLTVALAALAITIAGEQKNDLLVSHLVLWFVSVLAGLIGVLLAWFGPTRFETLVLALLMLNALANVLATTLQGPNSAVAGRTYDVGEAALCAVPLLVISFVARRKHRRSGPPAAATSDSDVA